ncbi:MAG: polymer-forming cytoskeletal protein [Patescibacteria group bacterium]|nr:polymer-forming cytoskeletal protein [Patescibacteria group bacterium]
MKKLYFLVLLPIMACLTLILPTFAFAQDQVDITKNETREGMQLITANKIDIAGTIKGDIFAIGQDITISGVVEGNIFIASSMITIKNEAKITGSAFFVGQKINLAGVIEGTTYSASSNLKTAADFNSKREFNFVTKDADLNGIFERKVNGSSENIILNGQYNGDILLKTKYLTYEPNLDVKGQIKYYAPYQALIKENNGQSAIIIGGEDYNHIPLPTFWQKFSAQIGTKILGLIYLLIIGFLWLWLWRERYNTIKTNLKERLWPALGWGAVILLLLPTAFLILAFSIIGLPLALILLGFVIFWAYLSTIIVGGLLGDFIMNLLNNDSDKYPYLSLLIGVLVLIVLFSVPIIGWIFKLFSIIVAFGVMAVARKEILGLKF